MAQNISIISAVVICSLLLLLAGLVVYDKINDKVDAIKVPSADEIASKINISAPKEVNNSEVLNEILEQVDERTDVSKKDKNNAIDYANDELDNRDFKELLQEILGIDEEDFSIVNQSIKDKEVTTLSEKDNDDGNFIVKQLIRVEYKDADESDSDVVYVVLTAEIFDLYDEENDQDVEYSVEEVSRNFEFE
jgi:hypothetical protein